MARILRQNAERLLGDVPAHCVFWCCDGRVFRNMGDLGEALPSMAEETFAYHWNEERCDFSNWVRDVIGDEKLARDLAKSSNPAQAARRVSDRVAFLSARQA